MATSWTVCGKQFKSPLSTVASFLLRSRENKAEKCRRLKSETILLREQIAELKSQLEQERRNTEAWVLRARQLEAENRRLTEQPVRLPHDPPLARHRFGARFISLCVNLAQKIGLRVTEKALRIFFDWLGVKHEVPHWTTIRHWMQRIGVAAIMAPIEKAQDWIWKVDHSNQIGQEKVLVILGIRASQLPEPGTPLRHQDLRVLTVEPGIAWKREDMAARYEALAERGGPPRAVETDGAVELREGAEILKKQRPDTIVLGDFKHHAANVLQSVVGKDERFGAFNTRLGSTRSAIQQTELAHLNPPGQKPKARFMNLAHTLNWAAMVLWVLAHPEARARRSISNERLEEKLGWLRDYAEDVAIWRACQQIVSTGVKFINKQGIFSGAAEELRRQIEVYVTGEKSRQVADRLVEFLRQSEAQLQKDERLPLSTEILESSFALYKQLERQHSKGGFTTLLAAFGSLLHPTTPGTIRRDFEMVSKKDVQNWIKQNMGETLTAKRLMAYREFAASTRGATKSHART